MTFAATNKGSSSANWTPPANIAPTVYAYIERWDMLLE